MRACRCRSVFFFFNDTATTEIYTLSLHDALPICVRRHRTAEPRLQPRARDARAASGPHLRVGRGRCGPGAPPGDRKSTRLNSSHSQISYAVFCLKKKKEKYTTNYIYRHH